MTANANYPDQKQLFEAIKNGGDFLWGDNMRFVHANNTLNVFIEDVLEYTEEFCMEEISEGLSLLKYYLQIH